MKKLKHTSRAFKFSPSSDKRAHAAGTSNPAIVAKATRSSSLNSSDDFEDFDDLSVSRIFRRTFPDASPNLLMIKYI